ncbi:hypothetical protein HK096_005880 [Nowakowskiella sp. JEL0078]|nr:hypothetical protein HK096_005880 [Nowakowskiella sp. JEL0078]
MNSTTEVENEAPIVRMKLDNFIPVENENVTPQVDVPIQLQCRMYENKYPEVDELVMVVVTQLAELGAYVHLLEYNNVEGMILYSELSNRRIRSIQSLVKLGRNEVVVVVKIDKERGYIDLSKRRVKGEDVKKCDEKFKKSTLVHGIMRHVAQKMGLDLEQLYIDVGWPLYKAYGHGYEAFKVAINDPDTVFDKVNKITPDIQKELLAMIRRRLTPQAIKIRSDIDVTCFSYEGIDAIKKALTAGEECSTPEVPIKIKLVAPPLYVLITHSTELSLGIEVMERAINKIDEAITVGGGRLQVKMKPKAVTETDDTEFESMLERARRENNEIDGDDDLDEADDADI